MVPRGNGKEPLSVYLDAFRRDQLFICARGAGLAAVLLHVLGFAPPIVNQAIQGEAFRDGNTTAPFLNLGLDLPRWLGGRSSAIFEGFQVGQLGLLFGLSSLFLFFVIVNGAFKYWINIPKGILGERMLRRMRFELFAMVLRFPPGRPAARSSRPRRPP